MPVNRDNLVEIVDAAWKGANQNTLGKKLVSTRATNRKRSKNWVDALGKCFEDSYKRSRHKVFWGSNDKNDDLDNIGLSEFLFDVMVCSVSTTKSLQRSPKPLKFIAKCHWQVESELDRKNSRNIILDMSKLVAGSAENKLFIASHRKGHIEQLVLDQCSEIAIRCTGNVYFGFVAHPNEWFTEYSRDPILYEWAAGDWVPLK